MSLKIAYTPVHNFHLTVKDPVTFAPRWEKCLRSICNDAFAELTEGREFNIRTACRRAARESNLFRWVRSDGRIFEFDQAWGYLTNAEWEQVDARALSLIKTLWKRKLELASRLEF